MYMHNHTHTCMHAPNTCESSGRKMMKRVWVTYVMKIYFRKVNDQIENTRHPCDSGE